MISFSENVTGAQRLPERVGEGGDAVRILLGEQEHAELVRAEPGDGVLRPDLGEDDGPPSASWNRRPPSHRRR